MQDNVFTLRKITRLFDMKIKVYCDGCQDWIDEKTVEVLNIEEDIYGRDKLTFRCPVCGIESKSLRVGG